VYNDKGRIQEKGLEKDIGLEPLHQDPYIERKEKKIHICKQKILS